jgi:spermidine synthase
MKISFWRRLWSYVTDVHVETTSSKYNENLHVVISKGRYQLLTPNAIYSFADKYDNYRKTFDQIKLPDSEQTHVLVLGLGLASIPYMLEQTFGRHYEYTCVEIDEAVVYLASKYVLPDLKSDMQMIQADAFPFVHMTSEKYDIICVDIFIDDTIPSVFLDDDFLSILDEILTEDGIILFNHLSMTGKDKSKMEAYRDAVFIPHYPEGVALDIIGNTMMINREEVLKSIHG